MKHKKAIYFSLVFIVLAVVGYLALYHVHYVGQRIDQHNGVNVYYNGRIGHTSGRNKAPDGYNLGMKWQCVEFVKRYYYQHLQHKMPDSYGNAIDFFDAGLADGQMNTKRNLRQFTNPSMTKPRPDDILVYAGHAGNPYGHVSILANASNNEIEVVQQNPGPYGKTRARFPITNLDGRWKIENPRILGWLRKE